MVYTQSLLNQFVLQRDHVGIVILWKVRMHAIARLARFSMANIVWDDQVILAGIEQLSRLEEHVSKYRTQELAAGSAGAMKGENSIRRAAAGILQRSAEGGVVHLYVAESLARLKMKIVNNEVAFMRSRARAIGSLSVRQGGDR